MTDLTNMRLLDEVNSPADLKDKSREELDAGKRLAMMDEAQKLWVTDAPWILTTYPATFEAMNPKLSGWVHYPDEHERWRELKMD